MLKKIKKDILTARKNKDKETLGIISTLLAEIQMVGKNDGNRDTTDAEAITVITKFLKNLEETFNTYTGTTMEQFNEDKQGLEKFFHEKEIYASYMPKQMSEDELIKEIGMFLQTETNPNMGSVMKFLKTNFQGRYNGKLASSVVKELLE